MNFKINIFITVVLYCFIFPFLKTIWEYKSFSDILLGFALMFIIYSISVLLSKFIYIISIKSISSNTVVLIRENLFFQTGILLFLNVLIFSFISINSYIVPILCLYAISTYIINIDVIIVENNILYFDINGATRHKINKIETINNMYKFYLENGIIKIYMEKEISNKAKDIIKLNNNI